MIVLFLVHYPQNAIDDFTAEIIATVSKIDLDKLHHKNGEWMSGQHSFVYLLVIIILWVYSAYLSWGSKCIYLVREEES